MKKIVLVFLVISLFPMLCLSQDIITLKSGEQIRSKIIEVGQTEVRYKKFDNQNGPVYVSSKSDITSIKYENGSEDTFNKPATKPSPEVTSTPGKTVNTENNSGKEEQKQSIFSLGFSGSYPTGLWPSTAFTNAGPTSYQKEYGHTVKSYGFGMIIEAKVAKNIRLFFDGNVFDYNILIAKQGESPSSAWTNAEGALHWDEPGAPQTLVANNLPTDVHFDVSTTEMKLGAKYVFGKSKFRPWAGIAFGLYGWNVNYCNEDKTKTYGKDKGYLTGLTYLAGIDFEIMPGITLTPFADLTSPVIHYHIEGLFYPQWNIDYSAYAMGVSRFGLALSFEAGSKKKK